MNRAWILAAALCHVLIGCVGAEHAATPGPIELRIRNATQVPLRCVAVLAHFVTRDTAAITPGETLVLTLDRDPAAGTLAYGSHRDAPMLVENILCGTVDAWAETRTDIPLTPLRAGQGSAYAAECMLADYLSCAVTPSP